MFAQKFTWYFIGVYVINNNIDAVYKYVVHLVISQHRSSSRRNSFDSTEDNEEPEKAVVDSKVFFECYFNLITSSVARIMKIIELTTYGVTYR